MNRTSRFGSHLMRGLDKPEQGIENQSARERRSQTQPYQTTVKKLLTSPLLLAAFAASALAVGKPNVLFIAIDDLRPELGCYGDTQARTPHIDKLASQGLRFDRAYCQVPICMGSRASLMTGILPTSKRFVGECRADLDTPQAATMPETFRKAGYTTISNGKIFHNPQDTARRSWSEAPWKPGNGKQWHDPETMRRLSKAKQRGRIYELPDVPDDAYPDGKVARKTIEDLQRLKQGGKPFFVACGFIKPHMPFYAPKRYWDLYQRDRIKIAENRQRPTNAPEELKGSGEFRSYHLADFDENSEDFHRMMRHGYLACTSYADKLVGDVLAELDHLGLAENTIVVLWGDHGWHLGEHNFWGKHNTMHLATRVPLIIRAPGRKPGTTAAIVETSDLFPTLCALAGIETPESVQGLGFTKILDTPDLAFREAAYSRFVNADAVITGDFSYTRYNGGKSEMLYDLRKDPNENENVVGKPGYHKAAAEMRNLLEQRMAAAAMQPSS
jgi:iduronate 2-sulfatase